MDYIKDDSTVWEQDPMEKLAKDGMLPHIVTMDFWQNMDSLRDKMYLEELWAAPNPAWRIWKK